MEDDYPDWLIVSAASRFAFDSVILVDQPGDVSTSPVSYLSFTRAYLDMKRWNKWLSEIVMYVLDLLTL